jgi:putative hydrolase of the HAD superfamily
VLRRPKGILLDFGGTLLEEVGFDPRAGAVALLARPHTGAAEFDRVLARMDEVSALVARREECLLETPWPLVTRLIYDALGIQFLEPMPVLEQIFREAAASMRPMPGARQALEELHAAGVRLAVVSNTMFGEPVIRAALGELAERLAFIVVSAAYAVRKPSRALFEVAAARLQLPAADLWMVGDRLDTDVVGARGAGMTAVWFSPQGGPSAADLTVASWDELVARFSET